MMMRTPFPLDGMSISRHHTRQMYADLLSDVLNRKMMPRQSMEMLINEALIHRWSSGTFDPHLNILFRPPLFSLFGWRSLEAVKSWKKSILISDTGHIRLSWRPFSYFGRHLALALFDCFGRSPTTWPVIACNCTASLLHLNIQKYF